MQGLICLQEASHLTCPAFYCSEVVGYCCISKYGDGFHSDQPAVPLIMMLNTHMHMFLQLSTAPLSA